MRIQFFIYNHNIIWFRLLNYHDVTLGVGQVEPVLIYCFVENRSYLGQIVLSRVETHTLPLILLPVMFVFFLFHGDFAEHSCGREASYVFVAVLSLNFLVTYRCVTPNTYVGVAKCLDKRK
jgi:hypothetical protein